MAKKRKWDESKVTRDEAGRFAGGGYKETNKSKSVGDNLLFRDLNFEDTETRTSINTKKTEKFIGGIRVNHKGTRTVKGGSESIYQSRSTSKNGVFNRSEKWKQANNKAQLERLRRLAEGR